MARKTPQAAEEAVAEQVEAPKEKTEASAKKENARSSNGYVNAKLKTRHCRGGLCKEKGETMAMPRSEYERLKKYGRVE
ncbi:hypothetical protein [Cycloclasticus pugetii]|uniref:hypothetical protein n=1 Tax=Cycloclasticus pugetii TaxID=34068 RepID=UPI003A8CDDC0